MTEREATKNFISYMERARIDMDLTYRQFAKLMHMSESGYYKLVNEDRGTVSMGVIMALYELTGDFMFQYVGCKPPKEYRAFGKYRLLKERDRLIVDMILDALISSDEKDITNEM